MPAGSYDASCPEVEEASKLQPFERMLRLLFNCSYVRTSMYIRNFGGCQMPMSNRMVLVHKLVDIVYLQFGMLINIVIDPSTKFSSARNWRIRWLEDS